MCGFWGGSRHGYKNSAGGALRDTTGVAPGHSASWRRHLAQGLPGPRIVFVKAMHLLQDNVINTCIIYHRTRAQMTCVGRLTQVLLTETEDTCKEAKAKARISRWALEGVQTPGACCRVWTVWALGTFFLLVDRICSHRFDFILFHRAGSLGLSQPWSRGPGCMSLLSHPHLVDTSGCVRVTQTSVIPT